MIVPRPNMLDPQLEEIAERAHAPLAPGLARGTRKLQHRVIGFEYLVSQGLPVQIMDREEVHMIGRQMPEEGRMNSQMGWPPAGKYHFDMEIVFFVQRQPGHSRSNRMAVKLDLQAVRCKLPQSLQTGCELLPAGLRFRRTPRR